ncbi:universal stress protein [Danxiaibacter flavus]|uniref:Universal stress protein n=1 Tax=Danxiaibacter flavus TaxID=3049108 RepID=A0ABV3ZPK0_9BACT|nr:universal stress protein [Chitinophagaceae bacterium DXS]
MPNTLYNILVPVDFTARSKWAIAKAIELANTFTCNIHLVHVVSSFAIPVIGSDTGYVWSYDATTDMEYAGKKLALLKAQYENHLCSGGKIEISVLHGHPQAVLADYIDKYKMDLVIKGLSRFNLLHRIWSTVSISSLARKTNVPVLAVRSSGLISHFKKIVLPLHDHVPMRRIRFAAMLGRYFKSTIYVLSLKKDNGADIPILNDTLEIIQSLTTIPVQSFILEGKNLAKATLDFSKKINADLIMITSMKEYCLPGLWNKITQKLLSYKSNIPVLTVDHNGNEL